MAAETKCNRCRVAVDHVFDRRQKVHSVDTIIYTCEKMDLAKLSQRDKEEELRVKTLLELSTKKYNLQKELETLKVKLSVKQTELKNLQNEVVSLKLEMPILEKQEQIAKAAAEDVTKQFVVKNMEIRGTQESIWRKINTFVSDSNAKLARPAKKEEPKSGKDARTREDKIRQLKVESEIEAMHLYEKYQSRKMEELKVIRDLLEKDSFVI